MTTIRQKDLGVLKKLSAPEPWQTPTFENSWVNFAGGFAAAGYWKDAEGVVHLRGVVKSGTVGATIFTLPLGYRPLDRHMFAAMTDTNTIGRVDVVADGTVVASSASNVYLSLDTCSFRTF